MAVLTFFLLDWLGALLFIIVFVAAHFGGDGRRCPYALGIIFQQAIASVIATLTELGIFGILAIVAALALYSIFKCWRRILFIRQPRMDRITVPELRELIDGGM
jgi:hypothetical protein